MTLWLQALSVPRILEHGIGGRFELVHPKLRQMHGKLTLQCHRAHAPPHAASRHTKGGGAQEGATQWKYHCFSLSVGAVRFERVCSAATL